MDPYRNSCFFFRRFAQDMARMVRHDPWEASERPSSLLDCLEGGLWQGVWAEMKLKFKIKQRSDRWSRSKRPLRWCQRKPVSPQWKFTTGGVSPRTEEAHEDFDLTEVHKWICRRQRTWGSTIDICCDKCTSLCSVAVRRFRGRHCEGASTPSTCV